MSGNNLSKAAVTADGCNGGVVCVNKPTGMTSHDVVAKLRRLYGTRQVGHTGTLDPMATGVLPVMIGRAVKASEYLCADCKHYRAALTLGLTTDTLDSTGEVLSRFDGVLPSYEQVREAAAAFTGKIMQVPPMYSALKVGGQKLYELARKGIEVERQARPIRIDRLDVRKTDAANVFELDIICSGGTYIRTLCDDIGAKLGCGGIMSALTRLQSGDFAIEQSHTLEQLEEMSEAERQAALLPTESLFRGLPTVTLPDFFATLCRNGNEIYLKKLQSIPPLTTGDRVQLWNRTGFFAIGEVREYEAGPAIKAIKLFAL